ncbi:MAG: tRNA (adenosine(37)-N6)-threonylcarbamoyltransferase complex ATPase subunit type 1 TsaE [Clostridiales Family XIII bacterium]|nr:tRNA (adenosine(37)-N6)-threonylcarbamoyltransferase complex ATPase subunit type 1 TsaE [Clostridiales Family XIII bacterium]
MTLKQLMEYGEALGRTLAPGDVVALTGDLGAGKTTLTRAIAAGLCVTDEVTSPTFALIHEYGGGRLPLYHFDVYRLGDVSELDELGYEDYFFGGGITVVEWADMIDECLPEGAVRIRLQHCGDASLRDVETLRGLPGGGSVDGSQGCPAAGDAGRQDGGAHG